MNASPETAARGRHARAAVAPLIALLIGYIGVMAPKLWAEYHGLRGDWHTDVHRRVIGFPGITPSYSHASSPTNWLHDEGGKTLLWAGWDRKASKHVWFVVGKGEISAEHLSHPKGRDSIRAIDEPLLELGEGEVWKALPPDAPLVAGEFQGISFAYPMGVLDKVLIVNDEVHKRPFLVLYTPSVDLVHAVEMFNPLVEGKRLTMGHSGYLWDGRPLLYDRQGESLWVPTNKGLESIAGPSKGKVLARLAHLDPTTWSEWSTAHPDGRLLAGAFRPDPKNLKP